MKRLFIIFLSLLVLVACVPAGAEAADTLATVPDSGNYETSENIDSEGGFLGWVGQIASMTPSDWDAFINGKIIPWVVLAVSAVSTVLGILLPFFKKLREASDEFKSATEELGKSNGATTEAGEKFNAASASVEDLKAEVQSLNGKVGELKGELDSTLEILRLAFGNMDELIEKNFAAQILKLGGGGNGITKDEEN